MANIEVLKIEKQDSGKVRVSIEARTIDGRYTLLPMDIDDCGSAAANEDKALRELQRLIEDLATSASPWVNFHIVFRTVTRACRGLSRCPGGIIASPLQWNR